MLARNSLWVSVLGGLGCVALGAGLGVVWAERAHPPVWLSAPALAPSAAAPSFADIVQRVAGSVVTVRALRSEPDPVVSATGNAGTGSPTGSATGSAAGSSATGSSTRSGNGPNDHKSDDGDPGDGTLLRMHGARAGIRRGSGFVCSPRGLVVTSRHVVAGALDVDVILPGREPLHADVVGEDAATDLALLRLADAPADLLALPIAPGDDLRAGDWIVAVGNPFGYAQTVTAGVVSFVGRHLHHSDFKVTGNFLQISAPVNPGSSGCPVFDVQGRVVGVTTQAPPDAQGISFAVPSRTLTWALSEMERAPDGRVRRGYLGIEFATCTGNADGTLPRCGAIITQVVEGQPAHRAGVRAGDVVVRVGDVPVADAQTLHERIVCSHPGTSLALHVLRGGRAGNEDAIVAVLGEVGGQNGAPN